MNSEDWANDHPEEYRNILDTLARRVLMSSWSSLHPIQNEFQRKIIMDLADDIITIVLGVN